jgi:hypothetical protein
VENIVGEVEKLHVWGKGKKVIKKLPTQCTQRDEFMSKTKTETLSLGQFADLEKRLNRQKKENNQQFGSTVATGNMNKYTVPITVTKYYLVNI